MTYLILETIEKDWDKKKHVVYKTPCGKTIPKIKMEYNYTKKEMEPTKTLTQDDIIKGHCEKCLPCKILTGKSHATVLKSQQEVADLFGLGIDDKRTATDNFSSENGILTHYSTIEAIRLEDGTVIGNRQCWNRGFAYCSHPRNQSFSLDLSTLREFVDRWNMPKIEILQHTEQATLIKYEDRYFVNGLNEMQWHSRFIAELVKPCKTLKEAWQSMKPELVLKAESHGLKVQRQGDLFFIPVLGTLKEPEVKAIQRNHKQPVKLYYYQCKRCGTKTDESKNPDDWRIQREHPHDSWSDDPQEKKYTECYETHEDPYDAMELKSRDSFEFTGFPQLEDTNHSSTQTGILDGRLVARGTIRHRNHDHKPLKLGDMWHVVVKNVTKRAVSGRGNAD